MRNHCSGCGAENPATDDGYTACCNERVCDGPAFGTDTWAAGRMTDDSSGQVTTVKGCCGATAQAAARALGHDALWRES